MSYLSFLQVLLALGPKLPQVIVLIQHIVSDVQEIIALLKPPTFAAAGSVTMELNATEQAAESQLMEMLGSASLAAEGAETYGAIGDGSFLRTLWAIIHANPKFVDFVLSLFAKA